MIEVEGTILSKGYDNEDNECYVLAIDTARGKRAVVMYNDGANKDYIKGLEIILKVGDIISFQTANPQQPVHLKRPEEIYLYKNKGEKNERS